MHRERGTVSASQCGEVDRFVCGLGLYQCLITTKIGEDYLYQYSWRYTIQGQTWEDLSASVGAFTAVRVCKPLTISSSFARRC